MSNWLVERRQNMSELEPDEWNLDMIEQTKNDDQDVPIEILVAEPELNLL